MFNMGIVSCIFFHLVDKYIILIEYYILFAGPYSYDGTRTMRVLPFSINVIISSNTRVALSECVSIVI